VRRALTSVVVAVLWAATPATAGAARTELVSLAASGGPANGISLLQGISGDGREVAFTSFATDLVAGDTNGAVDVFVRDRTRGTTERVNVSSSGAQANDSSLDAAISADGRVVAFDSRATNLVPGDTNGQPDIFVRDRTRGVTERVSVSSTGAQANSASSSEIALSRDGRYVAFASNASNLVPGDVNGRSDVFVHDRRTGTTSSVSVSDAGAFGNGDSLRPSISSDGRVVAFSSFASNLSPGDVNAALDVFVRDLKAGTTRRLSVSTTGQGGDGASGSASLDGQGRLAAFASLASNLVPGDTNEQPDVFLRDLRAGTTQRISVSPAGAQADASSQLPVISADGSVVVFDTLASNLLPGDTPGTWDLVLRDLRAGTFEKIDVSSTGERANNLSDSPLPDAKARVIAFGSVATNLVPGDTNGVHDVFVRVRRER
jgi:archaellum component FlaF (FlaF/FlaG flagellin family)